MNKLTDAQRESITNCPDDAAWHAGCEALYLIDAQAAEIESLRTKLSALGDQILDGAKENEGLRAERDDAHKNARHCVECMVQAEGVADEAESRLAAATALIQDFGFSSAEAMCAWLKRRDDFLAGQPAAPCPQCRTAGAHKMDCTDPSRYTQPAAPTRTEGESDESQREVRMVRPVGGGVLGPQDASPLRVPAADAAVDVQQIAAPTCTEPFDITTPEGAVEEYHRVSEEMQERDAVRTEAEQAVLDAMASSPEDWVRWWANTGGGSGPAGWMKLLGEAELARRGLK